MSLSVVEAEAKEFLASGEPEVLCVKGSWGVGKTFAWRRFLQEARASGSIGLNKYSYVSLFGLNSLDDLKYAIFEATVSGSHITTGADASTFEALVGKGGELSRRMRPLLELGASFFNRKSFADALQKAAFLSVRKQLICFDDLERAGKGLDMRDILGLASYLKEDRKCKVVLLLNDERMDEEAQTEFNRQLEKVADVTLRFDISPNDAAQIALTGTDEWYSLLRERISQLGITNIRIIKKIERLARKLQKALSDSSDTTTDQAITTLVLGCWSAMQPDAAPPLAFIKSYNSIVATLSRDSENTEDPNITRWRDSLEGYPYVETDELDALILDGSQAGFFNDRQLQDAAKRLETSRVGSSQERGGAFTKVWEDLYHGSLSTNDDEFLDALYDAAVTEAKAISPLNINSAIYILRDHGRPEQADDVINKYVEAHADGPLEFFDIHQHVFTSSDRIDEGLLAAFTERRANYQDSRDPLDVFKEIGERRGWTDADFALMSKQSPTSFEAMFEACSGPNLKRSIEMLQTMGRSGSEGSESIREGVRIALEQIGAKSPLRARKVASFGISLAAGDNVSRPEESAQPTEPTDPGTISSSATETDASTS